MARRLRPNAVRTREERNPSRRSAVIRSIGELLDAVLSWCLWLMYVFCVPFIVAGYWVMVVVLVVVLSPLIIGGLRKGTRSSVLEGVPLFPPNLRAKLSRPRTDLLGSAVRFIARRR